MCQLNFDILIDDRFGNINTDETLSPIDNKYLLSIINDFEDGSWRYSKFQSFIWNNVAETALSKKEREALAGSAQSTLIESAKKLRLTETADDKKVGEIAEILLYGIMRHHFHGLSVVPKIFYKQNPQDNAKGADSVHIVVQNDGFSLWFGEAKFYKDIADAFDSIVQSIGNSLHTEKLKKENSIITNVSDIDEFTEINETLRNEIKTILLPDTSIDILKPKLHIPILLLHQCPITEQATELTEKYKDKISAYHKRRAEAYFKKQIEKLSSTVHKYSEITFHLILFPVPSKERIISKFIENVTHYQNQ